MEIFCAVVDAGNYTQAASQLGLTPAAVSKAVARHETAFGAPLFRRTTRNVQLTDAGRAYYERCRQALSILEDAERSLSLHQTEPEGTVRISMPTTYGHYRILPLIAHFRQRHPGISFESNISNDNVDLVGERFDLAVRMGESSDSSLVSRKLEDAALGVFAAPTYLERNGTPQHPNELAAHVCIGFLRPSTGRALPWGFIDEAGNAFEVEHGKAMRCSGDVLGCVTLARHGAGLVHTYHFIVQDDVAQGRLVEVLRPFAGRSARFSLLQPPGQRASLAVQTFADALLEHVSRTDRAE